MSIPTKISCPCVGKYGTELTRGAEILMRVFCAVSEQDATQQARRGYPEYRVTECRRVET
jgi:hypothetical protein